MNRTKLLMIIDSLALICAVLITATGFILRDMLPSGSGRLEGAGLGHGAMSRPITLLWGMTRHEWGDIHFWLAIALLAVLTIHLMLHWRWIVCMVKGLPATENAGLRVALGVLALATLLAFAIAPFLSPVRRMTRAEILLQRNPIERSAK